jgi:diguanylate cyclase (GGDEF)-like protein
MAVVPLFRSDEAVGVLKVISPKKAFFTIQNIQTLRMMASLLGSALGQQLEIRKRDETEEALRHQAQFDLLTNLPNRHLFNDRLMHAIHHSVRKNTALALMYMDIDYFKSINDTYGHNVGDALLQEFAQRVNGVVRISDTLARLGGDEFALILEDTTSVQNIETVAHDIVEAVRQEFTIGEQTLHVSTSIGIATSIGTVIAPDELLRRSDCALYETKRQGRNGFNVYKG